MRIVFHAGGTANASFPVRIDGSERVDSGA
jgi:hypothetical protein